MGANVDPAVYYEAATIVNRAAGAFFTAYDQHLQALKGTDAMAGSAGPGKEWATSYDNQVRETNNLVTTLMLALDKYPRVLDQAGYVYATSDHDPKSGTPAPQKPADPPPAYVTCAQPPPSAGGPGSGLIDDGLELAKKIGVDLPVPDGDTDKLNTAATVWNGLAHAPGATNLPVELERAAAMFQQVTAPEVASIDEDLREIKTAAEDLLAIFADIAVSCAAQKTAHDNMKTRLHDLLAQFADELKKQVAIYPRPRRRRICGQLRYRWRCCGGHPCGQSRRSGQRSGESAAQYCRCGRAADSSRGDPLRRRYPSVFMTL